MLKKLVKYGNSNALVLDKALLELLNIAEGSVVKIKTDGTSLIITPQEVATKETVSQTVTPEKAMLDALQKQQTKDFGSQEKAAAYRKEQAAIYKKYADSLKKMSEPKIKQKVEKDLEKLKARFDDDWSNEEYIKEYTTLAYKYVPEIEDMVKEHVALSKKYRPEIYKKKPEHFDSNIKTFRKIHTKYSHIFEQIIKLNENPDYVHEMVLLAEKYTVTKDSPEYFKEYTQLIAKYIPEYADYQKELKTVSKDIEKKQKS